MRALGETLCGPVVLRSVGIIGLTGAIAALVAINPMRLDGAREAEAVPAVVLQPTVAATWDSSIGFTGSLPAMAEDSEAKSVRTVDPAELVPSVAAPNDSLRAEASTTDAAESRPAAKKGARLIAIERPAVQPVAAETAATSLTNVTPEVPAAPAVAWGPSTPAAEAEASIAAAAPADRPPSADLPSTGMPTEVALVAAPADPAGALEAAGEQAAASAVPLPKPRPEEVPKIIKTRAGNKATTPKAGALPPPPDCGKLHAYWRYTDRKRGLRQWYCR